MNYCRVVTGNKRNKAVTLTPKGAEVVVGSFGTPTTNGHNPLGSRIAPNAFRIIYYVELGKPYMFLARKVSTPQEEEMT